MRLLLDTHALIWATTSPKMLSGRVAALIADPANAVLVSAASAWEIATKVRLGRLSSAVRLERSFLELTEEAGYGIREVTTADFLRAGRLPGEHGDAFDRIIAAQALADDVTVVSRDEQLDTFGVRRIW